MPTLTKVYEDHDVARVVVHELETTGFPPSSISMLANKKVSGLYEDVDDASEAGDWAAVTLIVSSQVVDGQRIALTRTALASHDLLAGRLVRPFDLTLPVSYAYWIVTPKVTADLPKIVTFRQWLLAEAAEDTQRLFVMLTGLHSQKS